MESIGKHWQGEMPFLAAVRPPKLMTQDLAQRLSDVGSLRLAVQESGHDDYEVADALGISHGYMSKVLKGTAGLWGRRLVKFMQVTNNLAPLQWMAEQMGCDLVQRDSRAAEVAALKQHGPMTAHEIGDRVGLHYTQVDRRMHEARRLGQAKALVQHIDGCMVEIKRATPSGGLAQVWEAC